MANRIKGKRRNPPATAPKTPAFQFTVDDFIHDMIEQAEREEQEAELLGDRYEDYDGGCFSARGRRAFEYA